MRTIHQMPDICQECACDICISTHFPYKVKKDSADWVRAYYSCSHGHYWACRWTKFNPDADSLSILNGNLPDKKRTPVRFNGTQESVALYHIYGADGLLYVGISNDPVKRWRQHALYQPWWNEVIHKEVAEWFDSRLEAELAERIAIQLEKPKYNITHAEVTLSDPLGDGQ